MAIVRRAVGAASRRLGRPELLGALYPGVRRDEHEAIAIAAVLAGALGSADGYVDVGTNRGQVLGEAVRVAPRGRHVAFEPVPALADEVERRFPNVDCRRLALAASPGQARFCHFTKLDGWSGLRRHPGISDEQGAPEYIDVEVSTLDAQLEGLTPSVLKIDVEGAELAVLEGGAELLARARPLVVFEHVADTSALYDVAPGALWDLFAGLGYRVFAVTGEGPFARADFTAERGVVNWLARADR